MDNEKIKDLLGKMSISEKAMLCSGRNFWFTRGLKKYGIKSYMVSDGPHGLRKQADVSDNLGINVSVKATCYPTAVTMASSWDIELVNKVGQYIGDEAVAEELAIVLGPGANIKRSPLCGRNFEYYSEDPLLSSKMATNFILGVQSKNIGTSLKHFAVNNQEANRMRTNSFVDERALREIYLRSFEEAVKVGKPYTVMCSYNKINGEFASQNKYILTDILRGEWKYDGYVMTDWGAIDDRVKAVKAGLDLEMPGGQGEAVAEIINGIEDGRLSMDELDAVVERLLKINFKIWENKPENKPYSVEEHHEFAREAATKCAVLLKNEGVLPLNKKDKIIAIGSLFEKVRFQGSGSSLINSHKVDNPKDIFIANKIDFKYAEGFSDVLDKIDETAIQNAVELAKQDGKIVVFGGLTKFYESEGYDRKHLRLPDNQIELLKRLSALGKDIILVLFGGSPIEMPFLDTVKGLLNMYLPGQTAGSATYDLLFGDVNPSGKLAETFPLKTEDNPSYNYFPGGSKTVEYRESIFVGYRYYDTAKKDVLFPFGFGLSYTQFGYLNFKIENDLFKSDEKLKVSVDVQNIGKADGAEIVQLYVSHLDSEVFKAEKELQAFSKVFLKAGETKTVTFELENRAFEYYNIIEKDFVVESGKYKISVGASSRDIIFSKEINVIGKNYKNPYDKVLAKDYYTLKGNMFSDESYIEIMKKPLETIDYPTDVLNLDNTTEEARKSTFGKIFFWFLKVGSNFATKDKSENGQLTKHFILDMLRTNTFRSYGTTSSGAISKEGAEGLVTMCNGKFFKGLGKILKSIKKDRKIRKQMKQIEEGEIRDIELPK